MARQNVCMQQRLNLQSVLVSEVIMFVIESKFNSLKGTAAWYCRMLSGVFSADNWSSDVTGEACRTQSRSAY